MEFHGNFLSKWNFLGILFGGLLARITEYSLNGSLREVKFHNPAQGGASPSLLPNPNPLADPTKMVGLANPASSLLPHRVPRLVDSQ
jgi:hypothetical protein